MVNLREFNMSLLASWSKRFFLGGDKDWKTLVKHKYNTNKPNLLWSNSNTGSPLGKESHGPWLELDLSLNGNLEMAKVFAFVMILGLGT